MVSTEQQVQPESLFAAIDELEKNLGPLERAEEKALASVAEAETKLALAKKELKKVRHEDDTQKWYERARELMVDAALPFPEDLGEASLAGLRRLANPLCRWRKGLKARKTDARRSRSHPEIQLSGKYKILTGRDPNLKKHSIVDASQIPPGTLRMMVNARHAVPVTEPAPDAA